MFAQTPTGWIEAHAGAPSPRLRGLVGRYVGYREHANAPMRRVEVPTGLVALIISFGPSVRVLEPGNEQTLTSFVAALGDRPACTEYLDDQYGIQIDVIPPVAGMILGTRMGEFGDQPVGLPDALGAPGRRLVERLHACPGWPGRFELLDEFLTRRLALAHAPSPAAVLAWRQLVAGRGATSVAELADRCGYSTRYVSEQIRTHTGVSPKQLGRVLRVRHAIRLLDRGTQTLAGIAADCGYSDQAHFGREFRTVTGATPGTWHGEPLADTWTDEARSLV